MGCDNFHFLYFSVVFIFSRFSNFEIRNEPENLIKKEMNSYLKAMLHFIFSMKKDMN